MNIIIVSNAHRKPLITEELDQKHYAYHRHVSHDYMLPTGFVDRHKIIFNPTGCYRAFKAHQDALAHVCSAALVFEDDAIPLTDGWTEVAVHAFSYLDKFGWISLHGRDFDVNKFTKIASLGYNYALYACDEPTGVNGCCMAYWITETAASRYRAATFDGFPCDWWMWQKFKGAVVHPSPFGHDRSQGSLIDVGTRE